LAREIGLASPMRYRGSDHTLLTSPEGKTVTMVATPSDRRALKNVMADVWRLNGRAASGYQF
jgi:hypothetical protein